MSTDKPSIYDLPALERFLRERGVQDREMRGIRRQLFREHVAIDEIRWFGHLDAVKEHFTLSHLKLVSRQDSTVDGASKLLFETADGRQIETVILRISSGRTSLCVSSQTGCTEKCRFCATGAIAFYRNLNWYEILDQVGQAGRIAAAEDRKIRNIVFMGMGEALRNLKNVNVVLDHLMTGRSFQYAPNHLCVSSLGLADKMIEFAERFPKVNMALSLNAHNDDARKKVMPINGKYPMAKLRETLERLEEIRDNDIMISYVLFEGINDSDQAAVDVADYLQGLRVHVNLIPFNPDEGTPEDLRPTTLERTIAFQKILQDRGYTVTRRYSLGQDVAAACGQLANKANG